MTITGENLRIFANGKVVAAALNATMHLGVTTEDATTKDSPSGWEEVRVTGKSLELTSEALIQVTDDQSISAHCNKSAAGSDTPLFTDGREFLITGGTSLTINSNDSVIPAHIINASGKILATSRGLPVTYQAETMSVPVRVACPVKGHLVTGSYHGNGNKAEDFINLLKSSRDIMVDFAFAESWNNRTEADIVMFAEKAYITDISINAQAKQRATYTVSLKCSGEVTFDNGSLVSTLSLGDEEGEESNEPIPTEE